MSVSQYRHERLRALRARRVARVKNLPKLLLNAARSAFGLQPKHNWASRLPNHFDPRDSNNRRLSTPVRNQPPNNDGCTAYAVAAAMEVWWCRKEATSDGVPYVSPDEIFRRARKQPYLELALKAASTQIKSEDCPGGCAEPDPHTWSARSRPINEPRYQIEAIKEALVQEGPVTVSIRLFPNFYTHSGWDPFVARGHGIGGHALCVIGYESTVPDEGFWIVKNSYGQNWGLDGFGRIRWGDPDVEPEAIAFVVDFVRHPA